MFVDARTLPHGAQVRTDLCIIGAGAAGITIAREFIGKPLEVCVLESGGLAFDAETQGLAGGRNVGFPYYVLETTRLRVFGGTTEHWTGLSRPLEESDFEVRDWVRESGWPFQRSHLEPYYQRAHPICQLGAYDYRVEPWETARSPRLPLGGDRLLTSMLRRSPPTRFGQVYHDEIERAGNVQVYLRANVGQIELTPTGRAVDYLEVVCFTGARLRVRARAYVLATGGLENPRLLLASTGVASNGVGNDHDLVGRYFMEHPGVFGAVFLPTNPALPLKLYKGNSAVPQGFLCPSAETQRRERVLNFRIFVGAAPELDVMRASIDGVRAAHALIESARRAKLDDAFGIHVRQVAADLEEEALYAYKAFFRRDERLQAYWLPMGMEQEPNPNSRVMLTDERDSLGMPRIALDWRLGELEERTFHRGVEILASEVGRMSLGRVKLLPDNVIPAGSGLHSRSRAAGWPRSIQGQYHHMGTTRMARDPKHGVVNEDCRVHGIENLFIGGSSVFPTVGYTNPTLTIVAMSLRLADHLKVLLR